MVVETSYDSVGRGPLLREGLDEGPNQGLEEEGVLIVRVLGREEVLSAEDGERTALLEGVSQEADVVEETAQGPDVGSTVDRLVRIQVQHLGGPVGGRGVPRQLLLQESSLRGRPSGVWVVALRSGGAEVAEPNVLPRVQKEVLHLQVSVHDGYRLAV